MTVQEMVLFLRMNLNIPNPDDDTATIDPLLLQMTDEELLIYLNMALSQDIFADETQDIPSLTDVSQGKIYTLILYAKKELYFALATRAAPKVDVGADNNNYLKQDQRFKHYMTLIEAVDSELKNSNDADGGSGTGGVVMTYDTTLTERYFTKYNHDKRPVPKVKVKIINVADRKIEFTWSTSYISKFYSYRVWVSENPILDLYVSSKIAESAKKVFETHNPHENALRLNDIDMEKTYYITVGVTTMEGLTGYSQVIYAPEEAAESDTGGDDIL